MPTKATTAGASRRPYFSETLVTEAKGGRVTIRSLCSSDNTEISFENSCLLQFLDVPKKLWAEFGVKGYAYAMFFKGDDHTTQDRFLFENLENIPLSELESGLCMTVFPLNEMVKAGIGFEKERQPPKKLKKLFVALLLLFSGCAILCSVSW